MFVAFGRRVLAQQFEVMGCDNCVHRIRYCYIYVHLFIFQEKRDSSKINPVHWTPPLDDTDEPPESRLARGRPIKVFNIS